MNKSLEELSTSAIIKSSDANLNEMQECISGLGDK
jgi:hypothetical protein